MKNRPALDFVKRSSLSLLLIVSLVALPAAGKLGSDAVRRVARPVEILPNSAAEDDSSVSTHFSSLPLRFEMNVGQTDPQVRFLARDRRGTLFLTPQQAVLRVFGPAEVETKPGDLRAYKESQATTTRSAVIRLRTEGGNANPRLVGLERLPGVSNYFIGNDPRKWRTKVPAYAKVKYEGVYPGIDQVYYGNEGNLEYDFIVRPGADPSVIALSVEGAEGVKVDERGNLVLQTVVGEVVQQAPHVYQQDSTRRREIAGGYRLRGDGRIAFALADYDATKALVIDPQLVYATYLGGTGSDNNNGLAVDASGSAYIIGSTSSLDFPTKNSLQPGNTANVAFITKLSADGSSLVYSTYLGGGGDNGLGIAVDSTGAAYVVGSTASNSFPTKNAIQSTFGGFIDGFVTKLSADGSSLLFSTYLGGSGNDKAVGLRLDSSQHMFVFGATGSTNFPTVKPNQATFGGGNFDGFVSLLDTAGSALLYSTYAGGNGDEGVDSLVLQPETGDVFIFGITTSSNFAGNDGSSNVFFGHAKTNPGTLVTVDPALGVNGLFFAPYALLQYMEGGEFIPRAKIARAILYGLAAGLHASFDTVQNRDIAVFLGGVCSIIPPSTSCLGLATVAVMDGNNDSTQHPKDLFVIGDANASGSAFGTITSDNQGALYLAGDVSDNGFPLVNPIQSTRQSRDAFVLVYPPGSHQPAFGTFLGGSGDDLATDIATDPQGNIYVAGITSSANFPTAGQPLQPSFHPAPNNPFFPDGWVAKISAVGPFQVQPDFSVGFDQPSVTTSAGSKVKITININRIGGFTGNVTVTPPATSIHGVKIPGDPIDTTGNSVNLKIKVKGNAQAGTYPLTFTATDGSRTHSGTINLVIQ